MCGSPRTQGGFLLTLIKNQDLSATPKVLSGAQTSG